MVKRPRDQLGTGSGDEHSTQPRKKTRGRKPAIKPTAVRSFATLPNFPLDIWYEIFCQLEAPDLLHLARTSRAFRSVVLNRTAEGCWRTALKNVDGLPERPSDLSCPAYAHLMFSPYCHGCGAGRCDHMFWDCRARYCRKCSTSLLLRKTAWTITKMTLQSIDFKVSKTPIGSMIPMLTHRYITAGHTGLGTCEYRTCDVQELVDTLVQLDDEGREQLIQARQQRMLELRERPYIWKEWLAFQKRRADQKVEAEEERRRQVNAQLSRERLDYIVNHIKELGWGDVYDNMDDLQTKYFHEETDVDLPKRMKSAEWKDLQPRVVPRLEQIRKAQEWRVYMRRLHELDELMLPMRVAHPRFPCVAEVATAVPEVRELLTSRLDETFTAAEYDMLRPHLSAYITRRHQELTTLFSRKVRKALGADDIEDPLSLAAAIFHCKGCTTYPKPFHEPLTFQGHLAEFLAHVDSFVDWRESTIDGHEDDILHRNFNKTTGHMYEVALSHCFQGRHTVADHCIDDSSYGIYWARRIIQACGRDPSKATVADMDACDVLLVCKLCYPARASCVMTWRGALYHWKVCRAARYRGQWIVADEGISVAAQPIIHNSVTNELNRRRNSASWGCTRCLKCRNVRYEDCKAHLIQEHNVQDPISDDLYCHPCVESNPIAVLMTCQKSQIKDSEFWQQLIRRGRAAFYEEKKD